MIGSLGLMVQAILILVIFQPIWLSQYPDPRRLLAFTPDDYLAIQPIGIHKFEIFRTPAILLSIPLIGIPVAITSLGCLVPIFLRINQSQPFKIMLLGTICILLYYEIHLILQAEFCINSWLTIQANAPDKCRAII
jgi:hypothetical protein